MATDSSKSLPHTLAALPEAFVSRLREIVPGARWSQVEAHFTQPQSVAFRLNPLRGCSQVTAALTVPVRPIPGVEHAYWVSSEDRAELTGSQAAEQGQIYIQSASSMLAAPILAPEPQHEVLDLAAAPGGKTIHLASFLGPEGALAAVEKIKPRFHRLRHNLTRCGVRNCRTYLKDGRSVGGACPERFDRVLLDAPCSSEARMRPDEPGTWSHWKPGKVRECARKQHGLLRSAWKALKPGGRLLYCTCSFAPEENEAVVAGLLADQTEAEVLDIPIVPESSMPGLVSWQGTPFPAAVSRCLRVLPNTLWDGFFLALLRKKS